VLDTVLRLLYWPRSHDLENSPAAWLPSILVHSLESLAGYRHGPVVSNVIEARGLSPADPLRMPPCAWLLRFVPFPVFSMDRATRR